MDIPTLFESKAKQLFWQAISPSHVVGAPLISALDPGQVYFVVRLAEMYLASARKLWHQIYPVLHCYTNVGGVEVHTLAGPGQLASLGDQNLDRLVNLNVLLSGPTPYTGEDISILAGLYAIPGHDSSKALIDLVSSLAILDPAPLAKAASLSTLVKTGVESIFGLDQASLVVGVRDTFTHESHPLTTGYYAGIDGSTQSIDPSQIWVSQGRLLKGKDAASALPYNDHDYLLLSIERMESREDWKKLAELQDPQRKFATLTADTQFTVAEKRQRLAAIWPAFIQALADSTNLTEADAARIAQTVAVALLNRLKAQEEGNPFLKVA